MDEILSRLEKIERLLVSQTMLQKDVLNFNEAAEYLELSLSHLYKLTSTKQIPHFCPQGKKLYSTGMSWMHGYSVTARLRKTK